MTLYYVLVCLQPRFCVSSEIQRRGQKYLSDLISQTLALFSFIHLISSLFTSSNVLHDQKVFLCTEKIFSLRFTKPVSLARPQHSLSETSIFTWQYSMISVSSSRLINAPVSLKRSLLVSEPLHSKADFSKDGISSGKRIPAPKVTRSHSHALGDGFNFENDNTKLFQGEAFL